MGSRTAIDDELEGSRQPTIFSEGPTTRNDKTHSKSDSRYLRNPHRMRCFSSSVARHLQNNDLEQPRAHWSPRIRRFNVDG